MSVNNWTRHELILAFNLYCRLPFGRLHKGNTEIISLAQNIGRTSSAVAMKLVNFASFDPVHQARQISGLKNASRADREIWNEFNTNSEQLAFESQQALQNLTNRKIIIEETDIELPTGETEKTRLVRTRLVQGFFRDAVLSSYEFKCAICSLDLPELLSASHIIPWSKNVARRADPPTRSRLCYHQFKDAKPQDSAKVNVARLVTQAEFFIPCNYPARKLLTRFALFVYFPFEH